MIDITNNDVKLFSGALACVKERRKGRFSIDRYIVDTSRIIGTLMGKVIVVRC